MRALKSISRYFQFCAAKLDSVPHVGLQAERLQARRSIGAAGEELALQFLRKQGLILIARNWRTAAGELDLVMREKQQLVFVEVKTRAGSRRAERLLFSTITLKKRKKLRALAQLYRYKMPKAQRAMSFRIDVIGILVSREDLTPLLIKHIRNAV